MLTEDVRCELIKRLKALKSGLTDRPGPEVREAFEDIFFTNKDIVADLLETWPSEAATAAEDDRAAGINRALDRALARLQSLRNLPVDNAFDDLIEQRIDSIVERNALLRWIRRLTSVAVASMAVLGGALGVGVSWTLLDAVRSAKDEAVNSIASSETEFQRQFDSRLAEIGRQQAALNQQIEGAQNLVTEKIDGFDKLVARTAAQRASELSVELERQLREQHRTALEKLRGIQEEIDALHLSRLAADGDLAAFERTLKNQVAEREKDVVELEPRINGVVETAVKRVESTIAAQSPNAVRRVETAVNDSIDNLRSRLAEKSTTALSDADRLIDERRKELNTRFGVVLAGTTDASTSMLQGWAALQKQVSGSATSATAEIGETARLAKTQIDRTAEDALKGVPSRVASLEDSLEALKGEIETSRGELAGLETSTGTIRTQIVAFEDLAELLDENQVLRFEFISPALVLVKNTVYVALGVLLLSLLGALAVARYIRPRTDGGHVS